SSQLGQRDVVLAFKCAGTLRSSAGPGSRSWRGNQWRWCYEESSLANPLQAGVRNPHSRHPPENRAATDRLRPTSGSWKDPRGTSGFSQSKDVPERLLVEVK
ncbi:hypothetical protein AVEN_137927-1, partial [Araneus ventricosus]